jgi:hypothetical protein
MSLPPPAIQRDLNPLEGLEEWHASLLFTAVVSLHTEQVVKEPDGAVRVVHRLLVKMWRQLHQADVLAALREGLETALDNVSHGSDPAIELARLRDSLEARIETARTPPTEWLAAGQAAAAQYDYGSASPGAPEEIP